jgi:hypothetical protein
LGKFSKQQEHHHHTIVRLYTAMASGKKALLLGAGFVTKPTVDILAEAGVEVTVGTFDIALSSNEQSVC